MTMDARHFEIFLAEDNPADAELVQRALKEHRVPCTLQIIPDGAKAIEIIDRLDADPNSRPLDLCLLDMNLPKYGGEEILKRLRSTERYAQTPVIVMTGMNSPQTEAVATKHAAMVLFQKPSTFDEYMRLGSIVRDLLEKTRGRCDERRI